MARGPVLRRQKPNTRISISSELKRNFIIIVIIIFIIIVVVVFIFYRIAMIHKDFQWHIKLCRVRFWT